MEIAIFWLGTLGTTLIGIGTVFYGKDHKAMLRVGLVGVVMLTAIAFLQFFGKKTDDNNMHSRAFVSVMNAEVTNFGTTSPMRGIVNIKNTGQTPAYKLGSRTVFTVQEFPLVNSLPDIPVPYASVPLGAGADFSLRVEATRPLNQEEFEDIKQKRKAIYIYGDVKYLTFDHERRTNFLFYAFGENTNELHAYTNGNDSD